jgi:hypothetical protein
MHRRKMTVPVFSRRALDAALALLVLQDFADPQQIVCGCAGHCQTDAMRQQFTETASNQVAPSWRDSARAAARFSLKFSRLY